MTEPAHAALDGPAVASGAAGDPAVEALVVRARGGDLTAFNALVLRFQDGVYGLTLRMLGDSDSAEDATQDAFIRAWQRFETFRGGSFRAWLFTIAANRARDGDSCGHGEVPSEPRSRAFAGGDSEFAGTF